MDRYGQLRLFSNFESTQKTFSLGIEFGSETTGCGFCIMKISLVCLMCGFISLVNDSHVDSNLKEILVYAYFQVRL